MALTIDIEFNGLQETAGDLQSRLEAMKGKRLNVQIGRGVANLFQEHLFRLNNERRNQFDAPKTNFYADAAKATHSAGTETEATVTISQQGIRQRLFGGTIRPNAGKKYLTIPARAEAYARRAGEFHDLHFVKLKNGNAMLVAGEVTGVSKKLNKDGSLRTRAGMEEGVVMFWLVPSVTQQSDRTVLPTDKQINDAIRKVVDEAWKRSASRTGTEGAPL
jgi:hypothetical protein